MCLHDEGVFLYRDYFLLTMNLNYVQDNFMQFTTTMYIYIYIPYSHFMQTIYTKVAIDNQ